MPMLERITVAGPPGSGKTHNFLTLAEALPKSTFHVIDPEDGVERVRQGSFPGLKNIKYYFTPTWFSELKKYEEDRWMGGVKPAFDQVKKEVKPGDWLVIEALGSLWGMAQDGFVGAIFEKGIGEYFLEVRKTTSDKAKRLDALDGWKDWQVINKIHNDDFIVQACYQLGCHLYCTTSWSVVQPGAKEDPEVRAFYGGEPLRFEGQKQNPFRMQTLLLSSGNEKEGFFLTTFLKDRGKRRWLEKAKIHNFYVQYLVVVAGWPMPE